MLACMLSDFSHVQLFAILWTIAHQPPLSMELSRQEYLSGLLCPPPGDLPDLRIKPVSFMSNLHWQASSSPLAPPGKPRFTLYTLITFCLEGLPGLTHA